MLNGADFPDSEHSYDSLGEAYLADVQKKFGL